MTKQIVTTIALSLALCTTAFAQPVPSKLGSSTHIFPAGGQRGTTVAVSVGTECVPPRTNLRVWGAGVTAPDLLGEEVKLADEPSPRRKPTEIPIHYPREWSTQFQIAADAPTGVVHWRLTNAGGGTSARPFVVGELPEVIEIESNSVPERAEAVTLPVTINGRIAGERDADYFRFTLERGQQVACEVVAARLGSPLDAVLEILGPQGERVDTMSARSGSDPVLAFVCEAPGEHRLRIAHVGFHGGPHYVYRLTLYAGPLAAHAFPAGGRADTEFETRLLQLDRRATPSGLREVVDRVTPPVGKSGRFTHRSPLTPLGITLEAGDLPELIEADAHAQASAAQPLTLPVTVNGRFLTNVDEDWYQFQATANELLEIDCRPVAGSSALPVIELFAAAGEVATPLVRASAVDSTARRTRFEWKAPQAGAFRLRLSDLQHGSRGGPEFIYRLSVRQALPDFALTLNTDFLNIGPGTQGTLDVSVARSGGFNAPIDLTVEGLPDSVKLSSAQIPAGGNQLKLTFTVDAAALPESREIRVIGKASLGEQSLTHIATAPHSGVDAEGVSIGFPTLDHVGLTVMHKPLFKLYCSEAYEYAYRGAIYPYVMDIERLNGFEGEIFLQRADRQNRDLDGIEILDCRVAPGESRPIMPLYLPETMHINIQSQSQLYTQGYALFQDAAGRPQSMLLVSEKRNMLRTLPTVVKLSAVEPVLQVSPGGEAVCRLQLQRTSNFTGALELELVNTAGCTAERAVIPAGDVAGEMRIRVPVQFPASASTGAQGSRDLLIRATGRMSNGMVVVTEARVALRLSDAR